MIEPITFDDVNMNVGRGENSPDVQSLPVFVGRDEQKRPHFVSCWQLSPEALAELNENGGRIWVGMITASIPPVYLATSYPGQFLESAFPKSK